MIRTISAKAKRFGMQFATGRRPAWLICRVCRQPHEMGPVALVVRARGGDQVCVRCAVRLRLVLVQP